MTSAKKLTKNESDKEFLNFNFKVWSFYYEHERTNLKSFHFTEWHRTQKPFVNGTHDHLYGVLRRYGNE